MRLYTKCVCGMLKTCKSPRIKLITTNPIFILFCDSVVHLPDSWRYLYTKKLTSSLEKLIVEVTTQNTTKIGEADVGANKTLLMLLLSRSFTFHVECSVLKFAACDNRMVTGRSIHSTIRTRATLRPPPIHKIQDDHYTCALVKFRYVLLIA